MSKIKKVHFVKHVKYNTYYQREEYNTCFTSLYADKITTDIDYILSYTQERIDYFPHPKKQFTFNPIEVTCKSCVKSNNFKEFVGEWRELHEEFQHIKQLPKIYWHIFSVRLDQYLESIENHVKLPAYIQNILNEVKEKLST